MAEITTKDEGNLLVGNNGLKIRGLRWLIIALVFFATLINYIDRLTISVLAPIITKDLNLSNTEYGGIATWFLFAYTVSQSLSGKLYDKIGIKKGFTVSIIVWSIAAISHAFSVGIKSLSAFRFLLGLGEAGNWPGAAKTVSEWFPARQRALGMAIFNSGAAIGSIVAPPLIVGLTAYFGHWQETFIVTGVLGFIWLIFWWLIYDSPENHKWLTAEEYQLIKKDEAIEDETIDVDSLKTSPSWSSLLAHKQVWAIVLARFLTDPIW